MNNCELKEFEPDLVNYKSESIDIEHQTLYNEDAPLVLTGLTLKNYRSYSEFYVCRQCGKVYWQGAHWRRRIVRNKTVIDPEHMSYDNIEDDSSDNDEKDVDDDNDDDIFYDAESSL